MYRNIVFDAFNNRITLFTWDKQGNRVTEEHEFKPYLYVEDPFAKDAISLFNTPLRKITFSDVFKRKKFAEMENKTFFNIQPEQQFLMERFRNADPNKFYDFPLKNYFLDIETFSENGFPDPLLANDPINLISVHDSISDIIYTFGLQKEFYTQDERVVYRCFEDELTMMKAFIRFWRKDFPDIVSGWYSDGFDLPYLCNRINKLYNDEEACNRLSPVGRVYKKDNVKKRLEEYKQVWTIVGVTHIDYQYAYKVFTKTPRASYALNAIGEEELGVGKLQHNAVSLSELARNDWHKFVRYNIQDVQLLVDLEDKLKYLETCRNLAYRGLSPLISSLSTIGIVTGVAAQKALERDRIIPTFNPQESQKFEGGFVKVPQVGIQKALLYYDANSLYPNTIVTLNISPETKMGKIISRDEHNITLVTTKNKTYTLTHEQFGKFIDKEKICISKTDILFTQKSRGIFSDIIEGIYAERVTIKDELKQLKSNIDKHQKDTPEYNQLKIKIQLLDLQQYTIKIFLNRIYGYFAEKHSPLYDIDLAASVTLTGQACIKEASQICNDYINKTYGIDYDAIVMNDTDSVVLSIQPILEQLHEPFLINGDINPRVYTIAENINNAIDTNINLWARNDLKSQLPKYEFKRENISSSGAFLKKKNYILHIRDDEGKAVNKFLYKGVDVVRTSTPKVLKPFIKNTIETLIIRADKKEIEAIMRDTYEKYDTFSVEETAVPRSLNGYDKYFAKSKDFKIGKGTPIHVKGSIYYNLLLKIFKLDNKIPSLKSGDKIKFMYVLPNKYNIKVLAFLNDFPPEFKEHFKPDKDKMFELTVLNPIKRLFEAINWEVRNPLLQEKVDLLEMFGA